MKRQAPLMEIYRALFRRWGPQHWWPGDTPLEVSVGAVLTQNTSWRNVEKAIANLKQNCALNIRALAETPAEKIAEWIRPAGYFNVKARRLKSFIETVRKTSGFNLKKMAGIRTPALREILLATNGIGPETADSILLYAFGRPVFVADAYTRRMLERHQWIGRDASYDEIAKVFTDALPKKTQLFNEYHALIVKLGKEHCRKNPKCAGCPLEKWLPS